MLSFFTPFLTNITASSSWIPLFIGAFLVILSLFFVVRLVRSMRYF